MIHIRSWPHRHVRAAPDWQKQNITIIIIVENSARAHQHVVLGLKPVYRCSGCALRIYLAVEPGNAFRKMIVKIKSAIIAQLERP